MTPGFTTSQRTRPLLVSKLDIYFREKSCTVKSKRLIDELLVFIWNGNRPEAQRGYNDDLVMAFAISLFVRDHALKLRNEGIELNRLALNNFNKSSAVYNNTSQPNEWTMNVGREDEDITWLL